MVLSVNIFEVMKWWINRCDAFPSVSSVYSFFFYCFMIFFFRLDSKKNCSIKSSFVDFFFVKLQVFVYFLMRGILMIKSNLLMFFRYLIWGVDFEIFHCLFLVNDVRWGWNWGWRLLYKNAVCMWYLSDVLDNLMEKFWDVFFVYLILLSTWRCLLLILHEFVE